MKLIRSLAFGAALCVAAGVPAAAQTRTATPADVAFMQGMIGHHAQALVMSALVRERSAHPQLPLLAERITVSQQDEIAIMRHWLEARQLPVPPIDSTGASDAAHDAHAGHGAAAHAMPGMLTAAQLDSLSNARGRDFDRLFLQYMIQHHEGALTMVSQLLASRDAARDPMLFQFASDVDADQRAEIRRMRALLAALP